MGDPDDVMLGARVPTWLKNLVDSDPRPNQEVVRVALMQEMGGKRRATLEMKEEHLEQDLEFLKEKKRDYDEEITTKKQELERVRERIEEKSDREQAYTDRLDTKLDALEAGDIDRLTPLLLEDIAEEFGMSPDDVHADARERAAQQGRDIVAGRFRSPQEVPDVNTPDAQPIAEAVSGGED